ncbi:MAG: DNA polymerase III subunit delta' [Gammaproteobacteria bacterium]
MTTLFPWQQREWQQLQLRYQNHTFPHALLLAGAAGMGKGQFALGLAELLLCQQVSSPIIACGHCPACQLFRAGTHPDLLHLRPDADGKPIRIDQVRELIDQLSTTARQGTYQVAIIEPAEAMNTFATNALLKILEEPPGKVVIILVSHQSHALLATLRSRCQIIHFRVPPPAISLAWLKQQLGESSDSLTNVLALAEGIPLRALTLAREQYPAKRQQILEQLLQLRQNQLHPVVWVASLNQAEIGVLLTDLISIVMDVVRVKNQAPQHLLTHPAHYAILQQLSHTWPLPHLFTFIDKCMALQRMRKEGINLNWQLSLEDLLTSAL